MYFVFSLICLISIVDIFLIKMHGLGFNLYLLSINEKISIFIALAIGGVLSQFLLVRFVENKIKNSKTVIAKYLKKLQSLFRMFQYSLSALLVFMSFQMIFANQYYTILLVAIITFSYALMAILLGILASRFISWLRFYRSAVAVSYAITSIVLVINAIITIVYADLSLMTKATTIGPFVGGAFYTIRLAPQLDLANLLITIASFSATWISTAILLYHHSRKLGKVKYWVIIALPLLYFFSQFLTLVSNPLEPLVTQDPILYSAILSITFTTTKIIGGIFFGIAFWLVSRSLPHGSIIRDYMKLCSFGFIIYYISSQSLALVIAPYPPFGIISTTYIGLSSYLILVGIYYSALSASQDIKLRKTIKDLAKNESKLLDSIGTAATDKVIQNTVINLTNAYKEEVLSQTGVPFSVSEDEAKEYLSEVLQEIKSQKLKK